jgi:hypothetical protein
VLGYLTSAFQISRHSQSATVSIFQPDDAGASAVGMDFQGCTGRQDVAKIVPEGERKHRWLTGKPVKSERAAYVHE